MKIAFNNIAGEHNVDVNVKDSYSNCHMFTRDVIVELNNKCRLWGAMFTKDFVEQLTKATSGNEICEIYNKQQKKQSLIVIRENISDFNSGLLLFFQCGYLQHSMIVLDKKTWIGANNMNSLGLTKCSHVSGPEGICVYKHMDERQFIDKKQGGWNSDGLLYSILGEPYKLHYLPF